MFQLPMVDKGAVRGEEKLPKVRKNGVQCHEGRAKPPPKTAFMPSAVTISDT